MANPQNLQQDLTPLDPATSPRSRRFGGVSRRALANWAVVVVGICLALAIRISLLDFKSIDFLNYTKVWYNALKAGGFFAFGQSFSNYNLPYLYLLYLEIRFVPDLPILIATKLPSIVADFVSAWLVFRIVQIRYPNSPLAMFAGLTLLFTPTVVLNSAFWGQADALYTAACLACVFLLLQRRAAAAMLLLGVGLALKAQAIFLFPLVAGLFLKGEIRFRHCLLIPLVMLGALVPALVAGRPIVDLLMIYPAQAGQYEQLSMHAPSALAWLPDSGLYFPFFYAATLALAGAVGIGYAFALYKSPAKLTPPLLVELALIAVMVTPFVLPKMHERYFYLADVLSIVFAFYFPRYFFVPVMMVAISFFSYQPTLFGVEPIPIGLLAVGVVSLIIAVVRHVAPILFPKFSEDEKVAAAVE